MAGFDDETLLRTLADAVSDPPASDSGGGETAASVDAEAAKLLSAVGQEDEIEAAKVLSGVGPEDEAEREAEHGFSVGDLVWGKIKSHPWWPGQIYDPRQASKLALKFNQKGRLLVAYFGDDSFAWCLPSQLIPFAEHFEDMSKQSSSIVFLTAVQEAVYEVGRHVEMGMVCKHVGGEGTKEIEAPKSKNAGIQEGVPLPPGDLGKLFSTRYPSAEFLAAVKGFAVGASFPNPLELGILKGFLSAFNRNRGGGFPLAVCYEGIGVEGLEDPSKSGVLMKNDAVESTEAAPGGPQEEDWSSTVSTFKRKQKSVAEILGEDSEEKVKTGGKLKSALTTGGKRGRKRVDKMDNGENAGEEAAPPKVLTIRVNGGGTDENATEGMKVSAELASPRERKKSKYLSPPYTNPQSGVARLEKESESGSVKVAKVGMPKEGLEQESPRINKSPRVGESMTRAAGILLQTPPSGVQTPSVGKAGPRKVKQAPVQEKKIEALDVNVSPNKVLEGVVSMAGMPKNSWDEDMVSSIRGFMTTFRSCSYHYGEHYKTFRKLKGGKKGKSAEENGDAKSNEAKLKKRKSAEENGDAKSSEAKLKKRKTAEEFGDAKSIEAKPAKRSVVKLNEKKVRGNEVAGNGHAIVERVPLQQLDSVRQKLEVIASMVEKCDGKISEEEAANLETETEMLHDKVRKMSEAA